MGERCNGTARLRTHAEKIGRVRSSEDRVRSSEDRVRSSEDRKRLQKLRRSDASDLPKIARPIFRRSKIARAHESASVPLLSLLRASRPPLSYFPLKRVSSFVTDDTRHETKATTAPRLHEAGGAAGGQASDDIPIPSLPFSRPPLPVG